MDVATLVRLVGPLVPGVTIEPDTALLSSGLLDSFGLVELAAQLTDLGVTVDLTLLGADNADTCEQLCAALVS